MARPARTSRSASKENYLDFKKQFPDIKITFASYKEVIYTWNAAFANHILETGEKIKIPYGIGPLTITKYKPLTIYKEHKGIVYPNRAIDWAASKEENKIIYHLNRTTDGYKYYWAWFPKDSYFKFSHIWKFEMARIHSRLLSKYLQDPKDKHKDYYKQWITKL